MVVALRIRGGTVVTLDASRRVVVADVYVDKGRIVAIDGPEQPARRSLDATGMVVIPGMHDLHDHLRDLTPGLRLSGGQRLDDLLRAYWRLSESSGPDEYRIGAALAGARLLKAGVTSVVDHLYPFHRPGLAAAAVQGYTATGIRWFMARGIMTRPYRPICEPSRQAFREIRDLIDDLVPRERLLVAPVSFRQAPVSVYREARRLADRYGLRLYTHVAETAQEVADTRAQYGMRPVELLHHLGFTGSDALLVHCVYLSAREIRSLGRAGTHIVHCPSNHMMLAKGVTPVPALLEAGVNVGLGVDMMGDLFEETRQEVLLQGLHASDPGAVTPETALGMATWRGAAALGMYDLGRLEVGAVADLVCIDVSAAHLQPILDPVWTVVHRVHGHDVAHVVVDGQVVVRSGRLVNVDERALVDEAKEIAARYLRRAGETKQEVMA